MKADEIRITQGTALDRKRTAALLPELGCEPMLAFNCEHNLGGIP
jgi:hypothetical protein